MTGYHPLVRRDGPELTVIFPRISTVLALSPHLPGTKRGSSKARAKLVPIIADINPGLSCFVVAQRALIASERRKYWRKR